jgi:hypothetical protein
MDQETAPARRRRLSAITPHLKALDRLDRYQTVAGAAQAYDDEARKKLLAKLNRVAANLGVDEVMAKAAREHLKKIGDIPADEGETEAEGPADEGQAAKSKRQVRSRGRSKAPGRFGAQPERRVGKEGDFFHFFRP